jgi:hypothetical protein
MQQTGRPKSSTRMNFFDDVQKEHDKAGNKCKICSVVLLSNTDALRAHIEIHAMKGQIPVHLSSVSRSPSKYVPLYPFYHQKKETEC